MNRLSLEAWAMEIAFACSKRSTCLRRQVGAVLVNSRGHVLSTGYNGVAAGLPHCNLPTGTKMNEMLALPGGGYREPEHWEQEQYPTYDHACPGAQSPSGTNLDGCQAIHAEQNALLQCRDVYAIDTCYVTASPCMTCTKLLLNTSCETIMFVQEYPHPEAKQLWESAGRNWLRYGVNSRV